MSVRRPRRSLVVFAGGVSRTRQGRASGGPRPARSGTRLRALAGSPSGTALTAGPGGNEVGTHRVLLAHRVRSCHREKTLSAADSAWEPGISADRAAFYGTKGPRF